MKATKILLVDDDEKERELTRQVLLTIIPGVEIIDVPDADSYQQALSVDRFDYVVTEYKLSWGDGLLILSDITLRYPELPVIVLTQYGDEAIAVETMKRGACDYLSKNRRSELPRIIQHLQQTAQNKIPDANKQSDNLWWEKWDLAISRLTSDFAYSIGISEQGLPVSEWKTTPFKQFLDRHRKDTDPSAAKNYPFGLTVHPDDDVIVSQHLKKLLDGLEDSAEYRIISIQGDIRFLNDHALPIRDWNTGKVVRIYGSITDVSWQRFAEDKMRLMQLAIDSSNNGIVITGLADTDHAITYVNNAFLKMTGYTADELIGQNCRALQDNDRNQPEIKQLRQALDQYNDAHVVLRNYRKDGSMFYNEVYISPVRDSQNRVTHFLGIQNDVTQRCEIENQLLNSELRYRTLFENSVEAILVIRDNRIEEVNRACLSLWGAASAEQLLAKNSLELFHPDFHNIISHRIKEAIANHSNHPMFEEKIIRLDGSSIDVLVSRISFTDKRGTLLFVVLLDISQRKGMELALLESHNRYQELSRHMEMVREEERKRIAREIHDELGSFLTALKMELSRLHSNLPEELQECRDSAKTMIADVGTGLQTVKRIITDLRPSILDHLGLLAAVEWLVENFRQRTGIHCVLTIPEIELTIDADRSTAVFRILQEALTNILLHAYADEVRIDIKVYEHELVLRVKDNGCGIKTPHKQSQKSYGIEGMKERARCFNGNLIIKSPPKHGTTIELHMPLSAEEMEHINND